VIPERLTLAVAVLAFGAPSPSALQEPTSPEVDLAARLPALMEAAGIPAVSIAVIRDHEIAWSTARGARRVGGDEAVDENTLFQAASLSKPVVAYTVLRLVDQDVIDLDRPLSGYLAYDDVAHDERAARITARHVLSHRSGFPNWRRGKLTTEFEPGERYQYSGEGFLYLQAVLEDRTGLPLAELVEFETFEPLGMERSSFVWNPVLEANHATGHDDGGVPQRKRKPTEGLAAGTLHTTAREYARFLVALMKGEGLDPETHAAMLREEVRVEGDVYWGLGVGLQRGAKGTSLWQWGDDGPFKAYMIARPEDGTGVVYFTNSSRGLSIAPQIVGRVMGEPQPALERMSYDYLDDE